MTNLVGTLVITAYCATGRLCADNSKPIAGVTCAVSRDLWKYKHRKILIENVGERIVTDKMNIRWAQRIDLFVDSRRAAINFGIQTNKVWVIK